MNKNAKTVISKSPLSPETIIENQRLIIALQKEEMDDKINEQDIFIGCLEKDCAELRKLLKFWKELAETDV